MTRRNTNRSETRAVAAYVLERGVSHQAAVQAIRSHRRRSRRAATVTQEQIDAVAASFGEAARRDLMEEAEGLLSSLGTGLSMDEYTPRDIVEGDMERSTLISVEIEQFELLDEPEALWAEGDPERWGIQAELVGVGDVEWHVNAPSGYDIEFYGDSMGGDSGGPGLVQETETAVPVKLEIWGEWDPKNAAWTDIDIQYISMPRTAVVERDRRHSDQETKRMRASGELPSDEWIAEHGSPLWFALDGRPRLSAATMSKEDVPAGAGVYAWYRDGQAIYVGKAASLRARVWGNHLSRGGSLKNSSLRRNVADHLAIATANDIKTGACELSDEQLATLRAYIEGCVVAWIACDDADQAADLEHRVKREWTPPLTRM